jgi:RNA polymerase sigma factor (sigma-70 family)
MTVDVAPRPSKEFERRVLALLPELKRFATGRARNAEEAEDLVQETVLKALAKHYQFDESTNLKAWLFTILKNEHFSRFRKKHEVEDPDDAIAGSVADDRDDSGESARELETVMQMVEALDPQTKAILFDVAAGHSYEVVAEKHGIAIGTVKSRVNRARSVLLAARNDTVDHAEVRRVPTGLQHITTPIFKDQIVVPTDLGTPPILRWLPLSSLRIDPSYQREILDRGKANVANIARGFDWSKFGTVIVAAIDGGLFSIIDGQHRTTAANLCGITHVPCQVIEASKEKQAEAFAAINGNVTQLSPMQIHHAKVAAGDPESLEMERVCAAAGVVILKYPLPADKIGPRQTMAIGTIRNAIRRYGSPVVAVALSCLSRTRGGNPGMFRQQLITALVQVLARHPAIVANPETAIELASRTRFDRMWIDANIESKRERKSLGSVLTRMIAEVFSA